MKGRQQGQEALSVEPIRLGASASAIDKDACRLDDMVAHAVSDQQPMQPEAVAPRFEAGDDLSFASEPCSRSTALRRDTGAQRGGVAGRPPGPDDLRTEARR